MSAEAGEPPRPENYFEDRMVEAMNWLNVVGRYDHELPKPDTPLNRANSEVLRYLGDRMVEGDLDTAQLLSTFEGQARQATSESWISDAEVQDDVRTNTFYAFARAMNRYAGRVYEN
jgi:hypothetical protein